MRIEIKVIIISILFGILFWVTDAVIGATFFFDRGFRELLITAIPHHQIYVRVVMIVSFMLLGIVISGLLSRYKSSLKPYRTERDKAKQYLDIAGVIILKLNKRAEVTLINKYGCGILQFAESEIVGKNWIESFVPRRKREEVKRVFRRLLDEGTTAFPQHEHAIVNKYGDEKVIAWNNSVLQDNKGNAIGILSSGKDITDQREIGRRIGHLQAVVRAIINVSHLAAKEKNRDSLLKEVCQNLIRTRGYYSAWVALFDENRKFLMAAEAGLKERFELIYRQLKANELPERWRKALDCSEILTITNIHNSGSEEQQKGAIKTKGAMAIRLEHENTIYGILVVSLPADLVDNMEEQHLFRELSREISLGLYKIQVEDQRKAAEEALRVSEETYRNLFSNAQVGLFRTRIEDGKVLECNEQAALMFGFGSREEAIEKYQTQNNYVDPSARDRMLNQIMTKGEVKGFEAEFIGKDGATLWTRFSAKLYREHGWIEGVIEDITEKKRAENALRDSEAKYRNLVEQSNDVIYLILDDKLEYVNKKFCELTGYSREEVVSADFDIMNLVDAESRTMIEEFKNKGVKGEKLPDHYEFKAITKNGRVLDIEASVSRFRLGDSVAIQGILHDVTEKRRLEAQLLQSQRMEGIGRLAGGVAHDFNNLLTAISGHAELAALKIDSEHLVKEDLAEIEKAAMRASNLTKQLLAFSRKQTLIPKVVDLNSIITDMDTMLRRIIGEDIALTTIPADDLLPVKADVGQIEQVLINLVVNARDAMPSGGIIIIETSNVSITEDSMRMHAKVEPGSYATIAVSDTGEGMSPDIKDKIFEPFFTTKEVGQGTGLGLSTVYGIVKQSGGYIWVYSEPGIGSTFRVYLPAVEDETEVVERTEEADEIPKGEETVLVVEDEDAVREVAVSVLKRQGYKILAAKTGVEALKMVSQHKDDIDLVLTDVIMPSMGGLELSRKLHLKLPNLKVLFMSGYTSSAIFHQRLLEPGMTYLQKPFRADELAVSIRKVLDSK